MTAEKKAKIKKWSLRIGIGALAFIGGLATTFFLVPGRINVLHFDKPKEEVVEESHFSRFVTKVMNAADVDNDETLEGIVGSIDKLTVEWPDNKVEVNGSLALSMRNLNDFDATVDLGVNYNGKTVDLGIGYTGKTFYLAFQDLFIKSSYTSTQQLMDKVYNLFFNPDADEDKGLGMSVDIDGVLDTLIGGLNLSSLTSGGGLGGLAISFGEEKEVETNKIEAPLTIALGEDKEPIELSVYINKLNDIICGANLKKVQFGDIKISGSLNFDIVRDRPVYSFENEKYDGYRNYQSKNFIEVVNYGTWCDDIFKLLNQKKVGIDLAFSVDQDDGSGAVNIGQIFGDIDVDASRFNLWDYFPKIIDANTFSKDQIVTKKVTRSETGEENVAEVILDNLQAGIDLNVNRDEEHYADLNVTYADNDAFLSLNEDVIRAKMDTETLNLLISKVTELVEGDQTERARRILRGEPEQPGLFDFITKEGLIADISNGHFEGIIDVLESVSNTSEGLKVKLNLSPLNLGENAKVELTLDATDNGEKGVTGIKATNVQMAEGIFNLEVNTRDFVQANLDKVLNVRDSYKPLDYAVGIFDQVKGILDSKKAGFEINGSVLGATDKLGMEFVGSGQLDYGERYGFGDITIYNHTDAENPTVRSDEHPVSLYVDNTTEDKLANNMKLCYGPTGALKGKLSVKSLEDIVKVVLKIVERDDRRFAKFLDPIMALIYDSTIGEIIRAKDYMSIAKKEYVHKISQNIEGTSLDLELSKDLFNLFLANDLKLRLNFEVKNGVKQLASLEVVNLTLSESLGNKVINVKISVKDFIETKSKPERMDLNATYMDFSSLAVLLDFAIDSTELNVYHLTADVKAVLADVINLVKIKLDFYIEVIGEKTRVYGMIPDIPYIIIASNDANADVNTEFLFEPAKHYDIDSADSIGGYFHILRNESHHGWFDRNFEQYYYRSTSDGFLDNIIQYLLSSALDFKFSIVDTLGSINLDSSYTPVYESMFNTNGFVDLSDEANNNYKWSVDLNLGALTGITAFNSLKATIGGAKQDTAKGERAYLSFLDGELPIVTNIGKLVEIDASIKLVDADSSVTSWDNGNDYMKLVSSRYETITGIFKGLSASQQAEYVSKYQDKPKQSYRVYLDSDTPMVFTSRP